MKKLNLMLAYILTMAIAVPTASILVIRKNKKAKMEMKREYVDSVKIK
jgi:hypothetical protein